jgi:hypothetical protein
MVQPPRTQSMHPNGIALLLVLTLAVTSSCVAHVSSASSSPGIFQIARPTGDHAALEVVEAGIKRLEAMGQQPISIVGVVGGFHTGKSFLCNVLNGTTSGFELGPTHEATTMVGLCTSYILSPVVVVSRDPKRRIITTNSLESGRFSISKKTSHVIA